MEQERAEEARGEKRTAQRELAAIQAELDSTIATEDAYRAEEQRKADKARRAALATQVAPWLRPGGEPASAQQGSPRPAGTPPARSTPMRSCPGTGPPPTASWP